MPYVTIDLVLPQRDYKQRLINLEREIKSLGGSFGYIINIAQYGSVNITIIVKLPTNDLINAFVAGIILVQVGM